MFATCSHQHAAYIDIWMFGRSNLFVYPKCIVGVAGWLAKFEGQQLSRDQRRCSPILISLSG